MVPHDAVAAAALRRVRVWEPDLAPDHRYGPLADLDLAEVSDAVHRRLVGAPERVAWSAVLMGIASRLWSVSLVPYLTDRVLIDPECLVARHDDGAVTLGVRDARGWGDADLHDVDRVVRTVLEPLVDAVAVGASLALRLLWGNIAASLDAVPRVHRLPGARATVDRLLAGPNLLGEIEVRSDGSARRRTCCLFYLVEGAGLCGDCVFDVAPDAT